MQASITKSLLPEKPYLPLSPFATWPAIGLPVGWFTDPGDPGIPEFYLSNGFMVLHEALAAEEVAELNREASRICRNADGSIPGIPAAENAMTEAEILCDKLCIHFPHKISAIMRAALQHPSVVRVLTAVVGPDVKAMQSMLFVKVAGNDPYAEEGTCDVMQAHVRTDGASGCLDFASREQLPYRDEPAREPLLSNPVP